MIVRRVMRQSPRPTAAEALAPCRLVSQTVVYETRSRFHAASPTAQLALFDFCRKRFCRKPPNLVADRVKDQAQGCPVLLDERYVATLNRPGFLVKPLLHERLV